MQHSPGNYGVSPSALDSLEYQRTPAHYPGILYSLKAVMFVLTLGWNLGCVVGSKIMSTMKIKIRIPALVVLFCPRALSCNKALAPIRLVPLELKICN